LHKSLPTPRRLAAQTKTQAKAGNQAIYIGKGKYINDDPAKVRHADGTGARRALPSPL